MRLIITACCALAIAGCRAKIDPPPTFDPADVAQTARWAATVAAPIAGYEANEFQAKAKLAEVTAAIDKANLVGRKVEWTIDGFVTETYVGLRGTTFTASGKHGFGTGRSLDPVTLALAGPGELSSADKRQISGYDESIIQLAIPEQVPVDLAAELTESPTIEATIVGWQLVQRTGVDNFESHYVLVLSLDDIEIISP